MDKFYNKKDIILKFIDLDVNVKLELTVFHK